MTIDIQLKRVYEPADLQDGFRVLIDRLWPRGFTKEKLQAALWLKEASPSTELRKWYGHDPLRWESFKQRYFLELEANPQAVKRLLDEAERGRLTLLFSTRELEINHAVALKEYLLARSKNQQG
jgi:uncharacterized protein YeaO (DUF488 family)